VESTDGSVVMVAVCMVKDSGVAVVAAEIAARRPAIANQRPTPVLREVQ
jgi:hypothetical protein